MMFWAKQRKQIKSQLIAITIAAFITTPVVAANIVVNDLTDAAGGSTCTLRNAISAANSNAPVGGCVAGDALPVIDTIDFSLVKPGTINLLSGLPAITESLSMDGSVAETRALPGNPTERPGIELNLSFSAPVVKPSAPFPIPGVPPFIPWFANGLTIKGPLASNSQIKGLIINGFYPYTTDICLLTLANPVNIAIPTEPDLELCGIGILVFGANHNTITNNYIGLDKDGVYRVGDSTNLISLIDTSHNIIGGEGSNDRNVLASSDYTSINPGPFGILLTSVAVYLTGWAEPAFGAPKQTNHNVFNGNYVGLNAEGDGFDQLRRGIFIQSFNVKDNIFYPGPFGYGKFCDDQESNPCKMIGNRYENNIFNVVSTNIVTWGYNENTVISGNTFYHNHPNLFPINTMEAVNGDNGGQPSPNGYFSPTPRYALNMTITNNKFGVDAQGNIMTGRTGFAIRMGRFEGGVISNNLITQMQQSAIYVLPISYDEIPNSGMTFSKNSIYNTTLINELFDIAVSPPIDLLQFGATNGFTPNDYLDLDADVGPNNLQNFPLLDIATYDGCKIRVKGTLHSEPNTQYRLEFFANDKANLYPGKPALLDEDGQVIETRDLYAEGKQFLGEGMIRTNTHGEARFNVKLPETTLGVCDINDIAGDKIDEALSCITSTATRVNQDKNIRRLSDTSQISPAVRLLFTQDESDSCSD